MPAGKRGGVQSHRDGRLIPDPGDDLVEARSIPGRNAIRRHQCHDLHIWSAELDQRLKGGVNGIDVPTPENSGQSIGHLRVQGAWQDQGREVLGHQVQPTAEANLGLPEVQLRIDLDGSRVGDNLEHHLVSEALEEPLGLAAQPGVLVLPGMHDVAADLEHGGQGLARRAANREQAAGAMRTQEKSPSRRTRSGTAAGSGPLSSPAQ